MLRKILIQTGCCMVIILGVFIAGKSDSPVIQKNSEAIINYVTTSYTKTDLKNAAEKTAEAFSLAAGKAGETIDVVTGKPIYGEPIDEKYNEKETPIYAVGGGKVAAVGENEEIGKYIRIIHGDQAESLYGNLKSIRVNKPDNVKKGQIIGTYSKTGGKDFYYSFKEF